METQLSKAKVRSLLKELRNPKEDFQLNLQGEVAQKLCEDWLVLEDRQSGHWLRSLGRGMLLLWAGMVLGVMLSRWWGWP